MTRVRAILVLVAAMGVGGCGDEPASHRIVGELTSDRIELSAESTEPLVEILVAEGETVTAGQLIAQQDPQRAAARLAEQDAVLAQLKARLDELTRGPRSELIAAARANAAGAADELEFREADFRRVQTIHARDLASEGQLDSAQAALDAARANDNLRRAQLQELLNGTTLEEITQAEQAVKQAEARRAVLAHDLDRLRLKAPTDAIADTRLFEIGERPAAGQPVYILLAGEQPHARVYLPQALRANVAIGDDANIYVDGIAGPIRGRVRWIASESAYTPYFALTERDRDRLSYLAKVDVVDYGQRLPDGLPVEVELVGHD